MKLIIYMFALNEKDNIQHVISSLPNALDKIDFIEYLVIDDGSADNTAALAQSSGAEVVMPGFFLACPRSRMGQ